MYNRILKLQVTQNDKSAFEAGNPANILLYEPNMTFYNDKRLLNYSKETVDLDPKGIGRALSRTNL